MRKTFYLLVGIGAISGIVWFLLQGRPALPSQPVSTFQPPSPDHHAEAPTPESSAPGIAQLPDEPGGLSGHVLSIETGEGVRDVAVSIEWRIGADRHTLESTTDTAGAFKFPVDDPTAYQYSLKAKHTILFSEQFGYDIGGEDGMPLSNIEVWMQPGGTISGRVYNAATRDAISGVTVGVGWGKTPSATTGADGLYRIAGVRGGDTQLFLSHAAGYIDPPENENGTMVTVSLGEELSNVDFALQPGVFAAITGRVVDEQGQPVAGAEVTAVAQDTVAWNRQQRRSGKSKADGTFAIDELQVADGFYVDARTDGHASDQLGPFGLTVQGIHDLVLTLHATGSISGRVLDEHTGKPVTDPNIMVDTIYRSFGMGSIGGRSDELDEKGNFTIANLPAGSYGLFVSAKEWRSTGIVRPQVTVDLHHGQHLKDIELTFDYEGHLRSKAEYAAAISAPPKDMSQESHVGEVHGRVVRADTGDPVTTFYLQANHISMGISHDRRTVHDPDGRFTIEQRNAESLSIKISSQGYAPRVETVQGGRGPQPPQEITIRLSPGGLVDGEVTDKTGKPVAGAKIYVGVDPSLLSNEHWEIQSNAVSQPDGSFTLDTLSGTATRIYAKHPAFFVGSAEVRASPGTPTRVRIVLSEGAGFEGMVTRSGLPLRTAILVLNDARKNVMVTDNTTDAEGQYRILRLPPGRYTLYTRVDDSWSIFREADAVDGMLTVLDFDFTETGNTLEGRVTVDGVQPPYVTIRAEAHTDTGLHRLRTDPIQTGTYSLANLPLGEANVSVTARRADNSIVNQSFVVLITGGRIQRDFDLRTER